MINMALGGSVVSRLFPTENMMLWGDGAFRQTLRFNGTDYVNLGDSGWIKDLLDGAGKVFSIGFEFVTYGNHPAHVFAVALSPSNRHLSLYLDTSSSLAYSVYGEASTANRMGGYTILPYRINKGRIKLDPLNNERTLEFNGITKTVPINRDYEPNQWDAFLIGSRTLADPNFSLTGNFISMSFFDGEDKLVEKFDFQEGSGALTYGTNGAMGVIGDSEPTGIWDEKLGINKASASAVVVKKINTDTYNYNLHGDSNYTTLGFTNAYLTRTQIANLHNGTTIFTSPVTYAGEPRVVAFSSAVTDALQQQILNSYIGR